MFDTTGSRLNFSVLAGASDSFLVSFWVGSEGMSVTGATFQSGCYVAHGDERGELVAVLPVEHDSAENKVRLTVPELEEGHYLWELRVTDSVGKESQLLYGTLTALTAAEVAGLAESAEESSLRELTVQIGAGYAAPLVLRWQACSMAMSLAAEAASAAGRAEAAADRAEDAEENVLKKLGAAQAFMESFNKALHEAIRVMDNYLWVGGVNTGHYLKGDDGITPHIGTDGYWYVGVRRLGDRPAFGKDGITPHITSDGFWAFGDTNTTVRAEGRDGIDGSAVRRVLVDSYEDIPQSGETCNGGYVYYVPAGAERAVRTQMSFASGTDLSNYTLTGAMVFSDGRTWTRRGGALRRLGVLAGTTTSGEEPGDELLYAHLWYEVGGAWVYAGRSADAVAQVVNEVSWWEFDELELAPVGCRVRLVLSQVEDEPTEEQAERVRVCVSAVAATEGSKVAGANYCAAVFWVYETAELQEYDVYAWLESEGAAGWVRVDTNYDIATSQVYGVTKLGTDSVVRDGAPVGVNARGQMEVPLADAALPGSVMPASAVSENSGGQTYMTNGRMYVKKSTASLPGVGKVTYSQVVENTHSVGVTEDGGYSVPRAAAFQWGVCRVGTSIPQSNGMPWIIPVGMAGDAVRNEYGNDITGQLLNNVLVGGALRTALKETWLSWSPNGIDVSLLPDGSNAVGVMTSSSFRQTAAEGLVLETATATLLGGVTVCSTIGSGAGLVPSVDAVRVWGREKFYTKTETYSREETYTRTQVDAIDRKNRSDADAKYKTLSDAKKEHDGLKDDIAGCVKKTENWNGDVYLTLSEYTALKVRDPKVAYNILED